MVVVPEVYIVVRRTVGEVVGAISLVHRLTVTYIEHTRRRELDGIVLCCGVAVVVDGGFATIEIDLRLTAVGHVYVNQRIVDEYTVLTVCGRSNLRGEREFRCDVYRFDGVEHAVAVGIVIAIPIVQDVVHKETHFHCSGRTRIGDVVIAGGDMVIVPMLGIAIFSPGIAASFEGEGLVCRQVHLC